MRLPQLAMVKTSSQGNLSLYSAQIRSLAQLKAHLSLYGNASPLASLSPTGRQEFIDRLTFNENGLTGYRYSILEKEPLPGVAGGDQAGRSRGGHRRGGGVVENLSPNLLRVRLKVISVF